MKKKWIIFISAFVCICIALQNPDMFAQNEKGIGIGSYEVGATLPEDTVFTRTTEDGDIIVRDTKEMNKETMQLVVSGTMLSRLRSLGSERAITNGVVNFRTKKASQNTSYIDTNTGKRGYINGTYQADGAFLGYEKGKVKFMMSNVIGLVESKDVQVMEYDDVAAVNYYSTKRGNFYHNVALNVNNASSYSVNLIGKQPSYIKPGSAYYSYDGHYFYTTYAKMMSDYKAGTRNNAVNAKDPYYNYYQFASVRSKTSFTASDINTYLKSYLGATKYAQSKLNTMGQAILDAQNKYGVNGLMTLGVAINESAFGLSNLALTKNNLFGLNAVDSNPNLATGFAKPQDSINEFAKYYVHLWYSTPGAGTTYHGGFLGDKASGMNVSYASDPNWGETAAAWMWYAETFVNKTDVGKNRIGIKGKDAVNIRKEASTSSLSIYTTPKNDAMSFIILKEETGQLVNGSTKWYKIQLDPSLHASRTAIDASGNGYDFANSYGYIHSSLLPKTVYGGTSSEDVPILPTPPVQPNPPSNTIKKGDVNGDGSISSLDYVLVKNHILNISKLMGNGAKAADVNGDGSISSMDYVLIKNHILGISIIK